MASNESQKSKDSEESEVYRRKFYIPLNGDYPAAIERAPVYVRRFLSFWEDGIHPVCGRGSALKTDIRNWLQKEGMWKEEYDSDYFVQTPNFTSQRGFDIKPHMEFHDLKMTYSRHNSGC